ncbi:MAG: DUF4198 domain-containing protein [Gammaproteobacteria bacterium]|nr:DUF4198 domain-containing protein [Gammaproteobacteria bacterium]
MKNSNISTPARRTLAALGLLAISSSALAHDIYIWPSFFTIDAEPSAASKVPVTVTATHTTFRPDFAMPSDGVKIYDVEGKPVRGTGPYYQGSRLSTFDLAADQEGTYLIQYKRDAAYNTTYQKAGSKSDQPRRFRGNKSQAKAELPEDATDIKTSRFDSVAMAYVTNKAPTTKVLEPKNKGFEVLPVTHPADYITGEDLVISLLNNGEPVKGLDVVIEQEGPKYKKDPVVMELKSDEEGKVSFNLDEGGRYMFKATYERDSADPEADIEVSRVFYAFEVIYE